MKKIQILLIEDNRLLREGIAVRLKSQADFKVVAASVGNYNFVLQARKLKPDVVLVDLGLQNQNGLSIVISLTREFPDVGVIGMGLIPSESDIIEFVEAGASGFILKDASVKDFLRTVRSVARGGKVLPPPFAGLLFSHVFQFSLTRRKGQEKRAVRMTKREREIIELISDGLSNKEIAQRLDVATYTVKSHVHNIMEKLALHSRLQITTYGHDESTP